MERVNRVIRSGNFIKKVMNPHWFGMITVLFFLVSPVQAGRPLITEDAWVSPKGHWSLEWGAYSLYPRQGENQYLMLISPIWGASRTVELAIEVPMGLAPHRPANNMGLGNVLIAGKWQILPQRGRWPAFLFKFVSELGTSQSQSPLYAKPRAGVTLVASYVFSRITLHANAGTLIQPFSRQKLEDLTLTFSAALEWRLAPRLSLVGDLYDEGQIRLRNPVRTDQAFDLLMGLVYQYSRKLSLDGATIIHNHNGFAQSVQFALGFTYAW